ncbi:aminoglycoside adenylyltransferase domain-containing protein [Streptomyces gelaticus]|uniref:aminoglycoside adenylyltransferase domain-containing protein n=1 Tax=Streptomyces gelaticus TaxID=285446 RepID=UPI00167A0CAB|nr:aminoglycoside adenylyltransferase domain-containing protein [Streptomyces gelaticus]
MTPDGLVPSDVVRYVAEVSAALACVRPDLIGVYVHGSAVLGGFRAARSDVDVLAVVAEPGTEVDQHAMGEAVVKTAAQCPGTGLEMSVITAATAAGLDSCPFEVHIRASATERLIIPGINHAGDTDLVLHCAVCRAHALAVYGPPAAEVFGPVPADRVGASMVSELQWALDHANTTYAVLNACRALRFADDGQLCSKLDGGEWYLARHGANAVVAAAIAHQRDGRTGPTTSEAAAFVATALGRLGSPDLHWIPRDRGRLHPER